VSKWFWTGQLFTTVQGTLQPLNECVHAAVAAANRLLSLLAKDLLLLL